jgi:hypothetical protein
MSGLFDNVFDDLNENSSKKGNEKVEESGNHGEKGKKPEREVISGKYGPVDKILLKDITQIYTDKGRKMSSSTILTSASKM